MFNEECFLREKVRLNKKIVHTKFADVFKHA